MEGPSCPSAVCMAFLGRKWPKHREERMEKVTCSQGFLKPLISCGGGSGSASSAEAPGGSAGATAHLAVNLENPRTEG